MLNYRIIPVTPFEQNCSLIWCDETRQAAVIDPGGDMDRIRAAIGEEGVTLAAILLTHAHIDHVGAAAELAEACEAPIIGPHIDDKFWIDILPRQSMTFGFPPARSFTPNRWLHDDETIAIGRVTLQVRHCPGHTPGHVAFFDSHSRLAFVGDILFQGSIGRADFPRGNYAALVGSIRERLFPMGDDVRFVPGHGPMSTFGQERMQNPFVGDAALRDRDDLTQPAG